MLEQLGHEILGLAHNGKKAIEQYTDFDIKPDIILLDYRIPIKNGLEVVKEILQNDHYTKIIMASADISIKMEALKSGVSCFLSKPFDFEELKNMINKTLKTKTEEYDE